MLSEICMQQEMKQQKSDMVDEYICNLQIYSNRKCTLSIEAVLNFKKCIFVIRKCSDL